MAARESLAATRIRWETSQTLRQEATLLCAETQRLREEAGRPREVAWFRRAESALTHTTRL